MVGDEPVYNRGWPVVSTAANTELRAVLLSQKQSIAKATVEVQLRNWEKAEAAALAKVESKGLGQLLGFDFDNIVFKGELGEHAESDVDAISTAISQADESLKNDIWTWERLPYAIRCLGVARSSSNTEEGSSSAERPAKRSRVQGKDELVPDLDEWIIRNERFLRALSRRPDPAPDAWKFGLVRMNQLPIVFGAACTAVVDDATGATTALKIHRGPVSSLPGYTVLDGKRIENIFIQPSNKAFKKRWDFMTDGLLEGLNWSNIVVAGGIILGALLTPEVSGANKPEEWQSSDIDAYIYGLSPTLANKKIEHIAATCKKNLPPGSPFLVVRNSQTITIYSKWPRRRVQIVLKLVKSPREVLLNFDLDICGCTWDGTDVYLLPRCVRTLETATNTFVMDLINGHYLGDRKATRDKRVFKYANKGYGLRILPSYISSLATYDSEKNLSAIACGERHFPTVSVSKLAAAARAWTSRVVRKYIQAGHDNTPFHWPYKAYQPAKSDKPVFSHAMLESYHQVTSEPLGRSCLTGFTLFMRHVALWELEVEGKISIYEDLWATDTYGEGARKALDDHNRQESQVAQWNTYDRYGKLPLPAARITYGDSVEQVLLPKNDILIPLTLDWSFFKFANSNIVSALQRAKKSGELDDSDCVAPLTLVGDALPGEDEETIDDVEVIALWRLSKVLNWQMLDRRIDEIREVLWAYHRANERLIAEEDTRQQFLLTNISKRAIRTTVEDEHEALGCFIFRSPLARWVARKPYNEKATTNGVL
ncbi:hypothetical protein MVEN_02074300 [Mycena venus]|uniref:Uncharacterized protein n=1 Tax=Mycena venus TaxID=2733690 RepID=A0A8H6XCD7_9AGAR|nr:hypothetical protein MVEN_02074300 [Mycena venus]